MFDIKQEILRLKETYKPGMKVELIHMYDEQNPPSGTQGIISFVDDIGQIHVDWENGSTLALIEGLDKFKILS